MRLWCAVLLHSRCREDQKWWIWWKLGIYMRTHHRPRALLCKCSCAYYNCFTKNISYGHNFATLQQEVARCRKTFWFESKRQYEVYWYGETYVEKKEANELEEKQKKDHRECNQKEYEAWCARKMANRRPR